MNINATILGQAVAFILFVWFCMRYVWPPLITAIEARQKEIDKNLSFAEQTKKDIENAEFAANNYLQEAKKDAQVIIEKANNRYSQILEEAKIAAEKERKRIVKQAITQIDNERQRAREDLCKQIALLTITGAEKIISRSINQTDHNDIINTLVTSLAKGIV
ncbi:F0F1 ATP synthase subunit B [Candidatus Erwinia haradaeae]|uniref:ATP synthase subunit b n=1 Tax=Candidatus Erwinia haradaeae TaxID=1922217 RepID=A0A451D984_9GAMM|nr:F0F1 ATP synthase subunit B [Candidatus Erwinia haradaeae]VFP82780.1 ATP synthase subunit b [Candidatus Erwinia haradaeae]